MALITPRVWTRQPQIAAAVDWNGPLGSQIDFVVIPAYKAIIGRNASINPFVPLSNGKYAAAPQGMAFSAAGGTNDGFNTVNNFTAINGATTLSHAVLCNCATTTGVLFGRWGATASFGGLLISWNSNQLATVIMSSSSGTTRFAKQTANATAGTIFYGMTWRGGQNQSNYINGNLSNGVDWFTGTPTSIQTVNEKLYLCRNADSASSSGNTQVSFIVIGVNKIWSDGFHARLASNPWQIFRPLELSVPTYYPILSNLQATRGNTSAALRTNINY